MNAKAVKPNASSHPLDRFTAPGSRLPIFTAILFLVCVAAGVHWFAGEAEGAIILLVATVVGGYMALNIGANDVANNVAPAVGSKTLTLAGALVLAAIFETAGALIAGGDVVSTVSKGIIDASQLQDSQVFIFLMLAALLAGALWLNLATWVGAPVSTTHSIVGAVMGAGMAAAGVAVVNWPTMGQIAASWVISPVMGGAIAAFFYWSISQLVLNQKDRLTAARKWVPYFIAVMVSAFSMYLLVKGVKKIVDVEAVHVMLLGIVTFVATPWILRPRINKQSEKLENRAKDINKLFAYPLIVSAALLSFAHGANDVANAVGPLAAIVSVVTDQSVAAKVGIPFWVMIVGALGISLGLLLFGARIVNMVGESITKLDQTRAYCVVLSAAITVIVASALGLPVSTTHVAVGSIFGVGLYRETMDHRRRKKKHKKSKAIPLSKGGKITRRKLVRRKHLFTIVTAWLVTVPCASFLAALIFLGFNYLFIV